jgi:hypothetical protein
MENLVAPWGDAKVLAAEAKAPSAHRSLPLGAST